MPYKRKYPKNRTARVLMRKTSGRKLGKRIKRQIG